MLVYQKGSSFFFSMKAHLIVTFVTIMRALYKQLIVQLCNKSTPNRTLIYNPSVVEKQWIIYYHNGAMKEEELIINAWMGDDSVQSWKSS